MDEESTRGRPALRRVRGGRSARSARAPGAKRAGESDRPSWAFLGLLGLIGGGPTFLGTLLGQAWVNESVSILFLALAAGSILYVVIELLNVGRALSSKTMVTWGVLFGLFLGFATDFILVAAGV